MPFQIWILEDVCVSWSTDTWTTVVAIISTGGIIPAMLVSNLRLLYALPDAKMYR